MSVTTWEAIMRQFVRKLRRDRAIRLAAVGAALLVAPAAGAGGKAGYGCPPSFTVGAVTWEQFLSLPRHQDGLAAGAFDEEFLVSVFDQIDHNGDGLVCAQDVAALNGGASFWAYVYNVADDNASVPTR
jgi:hypothetical protein